MSEITKGKFRDALFSIATSSGDDESLTAQLRRALLEFGSETDDNVDATSRVEVGPFAASAHLKYRGIRLTRTQIALSAVVNSAEGCSVPRQVRGFFPDLQQKEWDAVLRVACLVLLSLEATDAG